MLGVICVNESHGILDKVKVLLLSKSRLRKKLSLHVVLLFCKPSIKATDLRYNKGNKAVVCRFINEQQTSH